MTRIGKIVAVLALVAAPFAMTKAAEAQVVVAPTPYACSYYYPYACPGYGYYGYPYYAPGFAVGLGWGGWGWHGGWHGGGWNGGWHGRGFAHAGHGFSHRH